MFKRGKNKYSNENKNIDKLQTVASNMQLPTGAVPNCAHFEMNSNREITVEGCKGILQYDENIVRINTGKMVTSFCGRKLSIKCLTPDSLIIEGFITSIEFIT